jgi:cation diffusion facilitator family transporter
MATDGRLVTAVGAVVNLVLASGKMIVGALGASGALVADGVHSLSDVVTDTATVMGIQAAQQPPDRGHAFGHGRYETLAALFVGVALLVAATAIGLHAVRRIIDTVNGGTLIQPRLLTAVAAAASIIAKEAMFRVTHRLGSRSGSPALIANAWHHRSDALSSIATLIGIVGAILLGPPWRVLDPLAALFVTGLIGWVGVSTTLSALREMTDHALPESDRNVIRRAVLSVPGTSDPHNIKTRRLGSDVSIEVHFRVDGEISVADGHEIASQVEQAIRSCFGQRTIVITHVEPKKRG